MAIIVSSRAAVRPYKEVPMFDSLADRMKQDQRQEVNATERAIRLVAVVLISVLVFGGLYFVVRLLE
jgi:small neutral amino acid transporter SnatA (MarC family)